MYVRFPTFETSAEPPSDFSTLPLLRPPRVSSWESQFGQRNLRFSGLLSVLLPFAWSKISAIGLPFHVNGFLWKTYVYFKPLAIIESIKGSLQFKFSGAPPLSIVRLLASVGVALFVAATATRIRREMAGVSLVALFTIPAYIAAYANPATSGDLLLCCLIATSLALGTGAAKLVDLSLRRSSPSA
jgi:hypothetical protein